MPKELTADTFSKATVLSELERILSSEQFLSAGRLGPFLQYVVDRTLEGEGGSLKEPVVGVAVFGRAADYDPRTDPIVRVEARRLRARLDEYYKSSGKDDPVVIELPKGTYTPVFRPASASPGEPPLPRAKAKSGRGSVWRALAVIAVIVVAALFLWLRPARAPEKSVAVLPFVNLSADASNEYFSDGLTDELIAGLARVPGLRVVARSIVFQHKGKSYDARALGRQLNAATVVEGSVRRAGERIRITAQVVNAADGYEMWSRTYERELNDVFAIQEEIATSIVNALRVELGPDRKVLETRRTSPEAYNEYLQARYEINRFSEEAFGRAERHLKQAIALDPQYAPAFTTLANLYTLGGYYTVRPPAVAWVEAKEAAQRALQIDASLAEAHAALGFALGMHEWKWAESESAFRKALALNGSSAEAHASFGTACLMPQGRFSEAIAELRRAAELDPLSVFTNVALAYALLANGRYAEAVAQSRKALDLNSSFEDIWWDMGMAYAFMGAKDEAMKAFARAGQLEGGPNWRPGPMETAITGDRDTAARLMAEWERNHTGTPRALDIARTYGVIGDQQRTLEWLARAWKVRDPQVVWLKIDPRFRSIRETSQYKEYLNQLGLAE